MFILLILIYRSPIFWFLPLLAVAFAELTVRGIGYALASAGVVVNGQTAGILLVLVFGAGTDYALLLVARYREELRRHEDKHEAIGLALRRAGPAILASGVTNICALLVLALAEVNGTAGLGPVGAMGVARRDDRDAHGASGALLAIGGRRAFWPFIPRYSATEDPVVPEEHGCYRRLGDRIAPQAAAGLDRHPRRPGRAGARHSRPSTRASPSRKTSATSVESVRGQELLAASLPRRLRRPDRRHRPGPRPGGRRDGQALREQPQIAAVAPIERGPPGIRLAAMLEPDPYSPEALDLIPGLRDAVRQAGGEETLVGGPTAITYDLQRRRRARPQGAAADRAPGDPRDHRHPAARDRGAAAADRDRDRVVPGRPRRQRPDLRRTSSTSPARTRRCRCSGSSSWSRWGSTTTSS